MVKIRIVENSDKFDAYKNFEYASECNECGVDLAVTPSQSKINKALKNEDDEHIWEWVYEHYFYCKKCQNEHGYSTYE